MTLERIMGMTDERICKQFMRHAIGSSGRFWVEWVYSGIDSHNIQVPEHLREQVASTMLKLRLDGFKSRNHIWIRIDCGGKSYASKLEIEK